MCGELCRQAGFGCSLDPLVLNGCSRLSPWKVVPDQPQVGAGRQAQVQFGRYRADVYHLPCLPARLGQYDPRQRCSDDGELVATCRSHCE